MKLLNMNRLIGMFASKNFFMVFFLRKVIPAFIIMLETLQGVGQTTIASECFENGLTTFSTSGSISGAAYYSGFSAESDRPANQALNIQGDFSYGVRNGFSTLITNTPINTLNYTSIQMSLRVHAASFNSTSSAPRSGDYVRIEVSQDGTNFSSILQLNGSGSSGGHWSFTTGTGTITTTMPSTSLLGAPATGPNTSTGYSTLIINNVPQSANLKFRITIKTNSGNLGATYYIDDFKVTGIITSCVAPPTQVSGISFLNLGPNLATVKWACLGSGDGVIVVVKEGSAPSNPVDGTTYTANTVFAAGSNINSDGSYVVYNGTGSSVDITGLDPSKTYFVKVIAKNCLGVNTKYNTSTGTNQSSFTTIAQTTSFTASGTPVDLDARIGYTDCNNPGTKANLSFAVSGLPNLSSSFSLASIDLTFDASGSIGGDFRNFQLYLKSPPPSNICYQIYAAEPNKTSTQMDISPSPSSISFSLRDGDCLRYPDFTSSDNMNRSVSGNTGVYRAGPFIANAPTLASTFNGIDPTGIWRIYASESTTIAPMITSARLIFGTTTVISATGLGESCADPINWNGMPMCASTIGKAGSTQMPGSIGGPNSTNFGRINGSDCIWNEANNNDVWIKISPTGGGTVCVGISGISSGQQMQSIIVSDANTNDTDPCTQNSKTNCTLPCQSNDPNWTIVSCPRSSNSIYGASTGTNSNQQHCFTAQAGKTYYLVVDGNGGNISNFYLNGVSGPLPAILSHGEVRSSNFVRPVIKKNVEMNGSLLQTNIGNKKYLQYIYIYDALGRSYYKEKRWIAGYNEYNLNRLMHSGLNIVKVFLEDESKSSYTFKIIKQ